MLRQIGLILTLVFNTVLFSTTANAEIITLADVGGVDNFIASTYLQNSGDATEQAWVESVLGQSATISDKYDSSGSDWFLIPGNSLEEDVYASALSGNPDYYLLKIGTGGTDLDSHYLFENVGDMSWAAVNFFDIGIDFSIKKLNIGRVSHLGEFGSIPVTEIEVPEPQTLMVLLLGLLALSARRLQRK